MNNIIISYQDHHDIKKEFSNKIEDKLNYISYKKRNNITDNLRKNDNNNDGSSKLLSPFEKFCFKIPKSHKNIRDNCSEDELCKNEIALVVTMSKEIFSVRDNRGLLIENSVEPTGHNNHIIDVLGVCSGHLPIIQENTIPKEKADRPLKDTIALLQLKSCSDLRSHDKREDSELSSKDIISKSVDLTIHDQSVSDIISDDNKMQNLGWLFNLGKSYVDDSVDMSGSSAYNMHQQLAAHTSSIPEHAYYMGKCMINILQIQMKPDSPDNVIATLCLLGNKLSIKLQVEASYIYKKIQNERKGILDALNFSGYTIDSLDVDFVQKDTVNSYQDSVNSHTRQQTFAQSGDFEKKKLYFSKRESIDKNVSLTEEKSNNIYWDGEIIGTYSVCIYV